MGTNEDWRLGSMLSEVHFDYPNWGLRSINPYHGDFVLPVDLEWYADYDETTVFDGDVYIGQEL